MELNGHAFLITGGASGLGAGCAKYFVDRGATVVIADVQEEAGAAMASELGANARFARADVTEEASVQSAIDDAIGEFGPLRGVVHCAGILHAARVLGRKGLYPLDAFARVLEVNLIGTFNVIRLAAAVMSENEPVGDDGERGVIVCTSSVAAFDGQIGQASYSASKGGVAAMMLPIARELAQFGIRVAAIAPGVFETPMMYVLSPEARASLEAAVPFPSRLGKPAEFAALAAHIFENRLLNGTTIRLDGALRMGGK